MAAWLIMLAIGLPWLGALLVGIVGDRRPRLLGILAVGSAAAAGLVALALLPFATTEIALRLPLLGALGDLVFAPDGLGVLMAVIATVVGALTVLFSIDYMRGEAQLARYYALVLLFIGAMVGLVLAGGLLLLFLFWELVALCSYALISFHNDDPKAVAGGVKALVITQIGGVGMLAAALTVRAYLGSDLVSALLTDGQRLPPAALGLVAYGMLIAAAAKSAQVPFHTWLPDAMEAPTPVSALIHAATMVNAGVYLLARFYPAFANVPGWSVAVMTVGCVSALLAGVMALVANDIKRVLAYSTISQLGTLVYAVGAGAIFASQYHLLSHAVFKALLFLGAGALILAAGTRDLILMRAQGRPTPFLRTVFLIGALALAGLPILNGFWSKELLLDAARAVAPGWLAALMLAGVGLTALYTVRMVWLALYGAPAGSSARKAISPWSPGGIALGLLAFGALTSWLLGGPLSRLLAGSLPWHGLHAETTLELAGELIATPATAVTLVITAVGLAAWWWRGRLGWLAGRLEWLARAAMAEFGFDWLNRQVIGLAQRAAEAVRAVQTGQLNWNMVGIVGGLALILGALAWGA